ncbi:MAG: ABC transporter ATP-binding protein [Verrucomicrobia bacterium]|jgi:putative ABC transport system ATP-binding protein/lipoprotein-releasing system ATP-binding protein|nr:ABC transporter ATP-binding protein [Verrucomicrobiota bacterium]
MTSSIHLRARGLHQTYDLAGTHLKVLQGVDLDVVRGEVLFLRGPSGAGKSTLLYILAGLEHPREGTIEFEGEQIFKLGSDQQALLRNRRMGFVFQSYFLLPELTALENVMLPAMLDGKNSEAKARALLDRVGLSERLDHLPSQLSGGEQQRVAIARALVNDPSILFADEPTGNLDAATGAGIIDLLLELTRQDGRTFVAVTHDPALAALGDRQLYLKEGHLHQTA